MSVPRFFVVEPLASIPAGAPFELPHAVAHHAARVLRLGVGDGIVLFDGRGGEHAATLVRVDRGGAAARIDRHDPVERESPLWVTIVLALLATDAMDRAVRKSVELGAARIVPTLAARSQHIAAGEHADKRQAHWRAIAIAACEQCGRNRIPAVDALRPLDAVVDDAVADGPVAIAAPGASTSLVALAQRTPPRHVLIGPEGGFTDGELARASARGATIVHLGARVLRADTAAAAALAILQATVGDAR